MLGVPVKITALTTRDIKNSLALQTIVEPRSLPSLYTIVTMLRYEQITMDKHPWPKPRLRVRPSSVLLKDLYSHDSLHQDKLPWDHLLASLDATLATGMKRCRWQDFQALVAQKIVLSLAKWTLYWRNLQIWIKGKRKPWSRGVNGFQTQSIWAF